ncbi:hypothetical protein SLE2022_346340 [Rubroshorea leprosula]
MLLVHFLFLHVVRNLSPFRCLHLFPVYRNELKAKVWRENNATFTIPIPFQCDLGIKISCLAITILLYNFFLSFKGDARHIHFKILSFYLLPAIGKCQNNSGQPVKVHYVVKGAGLMNLEMCSSIPL